MENTNIINNKNESENQHEIQKNVNVNVNDSLTNNSEISIDNIQNPSIVKENKVESSINNSTTTNVQPNNNSTQENTNVESTPSNTSEEGNNTSTSTPQTPELTTRKSSKNLTKDERLRRLQEKRKKKILASGKERLSRITKANSQNSYRDSDKDDSSSLSRKSSSRSINSYSNIERIPSDNSINKNINISAQASETVNSQIVNGLHDSNIHNLSRNSSINSLSSFSNNETINNNDNNNNNNYNKENNNTNSISETIDAIPKNFETHSETNTDNEVNDDIARRLLFRQMLKEEFMKSNNSGSGNINNMGDIKNNIDTLLTADKPFEVLGKMFDFLNVDEKTSEEQKIADEKYKQYCKLSKLIHTVIVLLYSILVVFVSLMNVHDTESLDGKRSFIGSFFYKLSVSDSLSQGKTIFGMTPWACLVLLEITLLAGQLGYQYVFDIKKETWKEFNLIPIPIINKFISLVNQYKLYIEILMNDLFLYLFILGISVSVGKIFY